LAEPIGKAIHLGFDEAVLLFVHELHCPEILDGQRHGHRRQSDAGDL